MERQPFYNPYVEPYIFFFNFFIGIPFILYQWASDTRPSSTSVNVALLFSIIIGGAFYLPRWISNIFNIAGGTLTKRMLPLNQIPSWRMKLPFPFSQYQMIKVMFFGIGSICFSLYYFRTIASDFPLLILLLLFMVPIILVRISTSSEETTDGISIEERKEIVRRMLNDLDPAVSISFFSSPFSIAYVKRKRVFISEKALKLPIGDLKRLVFHEYAHTRQKTKYLFFILVFYFLLLMGIIIILKNIWLLFSIFPTALYLFILSGTQYLLLWYLLSLPVPFFIARWIIWKMELDAEKWACHQLGSEEYSKAVNKSLEQLKTWRKFHSRVPWLGLERFYLYYPPIINQILNALKECKSQ